MKTSQIKLKASEFRLLDEVFEMGDGYVLDFTNKTFSEFFSDELQIDIYSSEYAVEGTSKAKRLRYFLRTSNTDTVLATLSALWDYRVATEHLSSIGELPLNVSKAFTKLLGRLGGGQHGDIAKPDQDTECFSQIVSIQLTNRLLEVTSMRPQQRGYAYESFLKEVFEAYGLSAKSAFRITGEQIDGSFQMGNETYLLEAKWQNEQTGAADLHTFEGKLGEKAAWSRGLFVSNSGFTTEGLHAFGRGKRLVCMDGFDLSEMLRHRISFVDVMDAKVRAAAETGNPFISVRELFPDK